MITVKPVYFGFMIIIFNLFYVLLSGNCLRLEIFFKLEEKALIVPSLFEFVLLWFVNGTTQSTISCSRLQGGFDCVA